MNPLKQLCTASRSHLAATSTVGPCRFFLDYYWHLRASLKRSYPSKLNLTAFYSLFHVNVLLVEATAFDRSARREKGLLKNLHCNTSLTVLFLLLLRGRRFELGQASNLRLYPGTNSGIAVLLRQVPFLSHKILRAAEQCCREGEDRLPNCPAVPVD
eukprot:5792322-Pyramimonas_sp.AAC.1